MPSAKPKARQKPASALLNASASVATFLAAIGREVRRNRAKRGMTRRQLAQASETSERYLAQIESGAGNPSASVLRAIAQALDLPASALLPEAGARTAALDAYGKVEAHELDDHAYIDPVSTYVLAQARITSLKAAAK